uniref:Reticulocalbin-3 n=1 Tax=Dugesia japonica TaxID=6161 RepID=A0A1B4XSS5_DUGJA|nr:calumenin [Dugesia japonica]
MIKLLLCLCLFVSVLSGSTRQRDLSDVEHHSDAEIHDLNYDHKAFLGKEEAERYSELTPEESKNRLRILVENKVDRNKDGKVTKSELADWIKQVSKKWMMDERDRVWNDYNPQNKSHLNFNLYSDINYGENIEQRYQGDELKRVLKEREMDRQKWQLADDNKDGLLDIEEFFAYIRPEEVPRMKPFLVDEMLDRADKNHDSYIDIEEYTDELYTREPNIVRNKDPQPEWIKFELEHFSIHRDTNNDKRMDRKEIGEWILPTNYDGIESEVHHLMAHADKNKDDELSIEEIIEQSDLFAGSQATNYGLTLKNKDEL